MKKLTAFLCVLIGLNFAACSSRPVTNDAAEELSEAVTDADPSSLGQTEADTAQTASDQSEQDVRLKRYSGTVPVVYMTREITAGSLLNLYKSLGRELKGNHTAVSISAFAGENALEPELIGSLVQYVDGTIVMSSTAGNTVENLYAQAEEQGFTKIADVVIMDEDGSVPIPVEDGVHLRENYVGAHFPEYDGFLVISHFYGHAVSGFSGAVENISVGLSSAEGKCLIHSAGSSPTDASVKAQDAFLESMAEAGKSVADAVDRNIIYINVMIDLTTGEGDGQDLAETEMQDIGILACDDPVALDQACVDLIYMAEGNEAFVNCIEEMNAEYVLEYADEIGLGNSAYTLVSLE